MKYLRFSNFERYWHLFFRFGIFIKAFNGLWETIGGCLLLVTNKITLTNLFYSFAAEELLEDPSDFTINFLGHAVQNVSLNTKTFVGLYILFHGLINLFLAIQLYRNKVWAYLTSVSIMTIFMVYQIDHIFLHHSVTLAVITFFDLFFIILTWHEYKQQKVGIKPSNY